MMAAIGAVEVLVVGRNMMRLRCLPCGKVRLLRRAHFQSVKTLLTVWLPSQTSCNAQARCHVPRLIRTTTSKKQKGKAVVSRSLSYYDRLASPIVVFHKLTRV